MIPHGERWYYLARKKLSTLLREITSKHHGDFYCLNFYCPSFFCNRKKLESQRDYAKIKIFVM